MPRSKSSPPQKNALKPGTGVRSALCLPSQLMEGHKMRQEDVEAFGLVGFIKVMKTIFYNNYYSETIRLNLILSRIHLIALLANVVSNFYLIA